MYDNVINIIEHTGSVLGPHVDENTMYITSDLRTIEAGVQLRKRCQIIAALGKLEIDLKNFVPKATKIPKLPELVMKTIRLAKCERKKFAKEEGSFTEINRIVKKMGWELEAITPQ